MKNALLVTRLHTDGIGKTSALLSVPRTKEELAPHLPTAHTKQVNKIKLKTSIFIEENVLIIPPFYLHSHRIK
jgi:hypothetical protein